MHKLPNGAYVTEHGSEVRISGEHSGKVVCWFDWVEEPNACIECRVDPYPDDEGFLTWECDHCGGGRAELKPYQEQEQADE